jgi:hypothetical protein
MSWSHFCPYRLCLFPLLVAGALLHAEPPNLDSLAANSPFAAPGVRGKAEASTPLEFRGVIYEGATAYFSIFEASTRQSLWVELNEPGLNYTLRSYDSANARLQVDYQGRSLTLGLVQAPKSARAGLPVVATPPPGTSGAVNPAIAPPAPNPQLPAQIAEEIRRRRALRQGTATPPPNPNKP